MREQPEDDVLVQLLRGDRLVPVREDESEAWTAWLAALEVNGYLGVELDPRSLLAAEVLLWRHRVRGSEQLHTGHGGRLWLLDDNGSRAGLAELRNRGQWAEISLLYVLPERRRSGLGRQLVQAVATAAGTAGMRGAIVETQWTWPQAWQSYRGMGLWLLHFKRGMVFARTPSGAIPDIRETATRLEVWVAGPDGPELLAWAEREPAGELLAFGLAEQAGIEGTIEQMLAGSTLTAELAFRGWPLMGPAVDERSRAADGGLAPGALAWRLDSWESYAREQGWVVPAGLPDPPRDREP